MEKFGSTSKARAGHLAIVRKSDFVLIEGSYQHSPERCEMKSGKVKCYTVESISLPNLSLAWVVPHYCMED